MLAPDMTFISQMLGIYKRQVSANMQSTHTHTHILLLRSRFYILAMYVQMLDIYKKYRTKSDFF